SGDYQKHGVRFVMFRKTPTHHGAGLFADHEPETKPSAPAAWRADNYGGGRREPCPPAARGVRRHPPRGMTPPPTENKRPRDKQRGRILRIDCRAGLRAI